MALSTWVAFVIIAALMESMDPLPKRLPKAIATELHSHDHAHHLPLSDPRSRRRHLRFCESRFRCRPALLRSPSRYYAITTAIYQMIQQYPPKI